jgi:hypothetical protein
MGIWAVPNTVEKAEKLQNLLRKKISRQRAQLETYSLLGDDKLMDAFKEIGPREDARSPIAYRLKEILEMPEEGFTAQWEPKARQICAQIVKDFGWPVDTKADEPVIFVSWSVADIIELAEGHEDNLDMSVEEIRAALIYAARNEYHAGRDSILDSIKDAHRVLAGVQ